MPCMTRKKSPKIFKRLDQSPRDIQRALDTFSDNANAFTLTKDEALEKYKDKWIAIYKGTVRAVADTLEQLSAQVAQKNIPKSETLFRRIDSKEKVFIL